MQAGHLHRPAMHEGAQPAKGCTLNKWAGPRKSPCGYRNSNQRDRTAQCRESSQARPSSHALLGGHPLPGHPALIHESKAGASYNMQETQPSTSVPSNAIWRSRM